MIAYLVMDGSLADACAIRLHCTYVQRPAWFAFVCKVGLVFAVSQNAYHGEEAEKGFLLYFQRA